MENKENIFTKILGWVKSHITIVVIAVVAIVALILCFSIFTGGPKKVVKKYISAMNKQNAEKVVDCFDFAGQEAWSFWYDIDDFSEEEYNEFIEEYNNIEKEDIADTKKYTLTTLTSAFAMMDVEYKNFKIKLEEVKDVTEIGKDLYAVKAKVSVYAKPADKEVTDEIDETSVMTFVVYKNKIISSDLDF